MKKNLIYYFLIFLLLSSNKLDEAAEKGKKDGESKLKGSEIFSQIKSADLLSPNEQKKNFDGEKAKSDILTNNIDDSLENKVMREVIHQSSANKNQFSLPSEETIEKANKISADPLKVLNQSGITSEEYIEREEILEDEIKKCDESGDPYKLTVNRDLTASLIYHPEVTTKTKICLGCQESYQTQTYHPEITRTDKICMGHSEVKEDRTIWTCDGHDFYSGESFYFQTDASDYIRRLDRECSRNDSLKSYDCYRSSNGGLFSKYQTYYRYWHKDSHYKCEARTYGYKINHWYHSYNGYSHTWNLSGTNIGPSRDSTNCCNCNDKIVVVKNAYYSSNTHYRTKYHPNNSNDCSNYRIDIKIISPETYSDGENTYQIDNVVSLETGIGENCTLDRIICLDKSPRYILANNGTRHLVTRPCWTEQQQYICTHPHKKECSVLRSKSCTEIASECIEPSPYGCAMWRRTYQCIKSKKSSFKGIKSNMYGMDPKLFQEKEEVNNKFPEVLAKLAVFDEMKKDLEQGGERDVKNDIQIFKGLKLNCKKNICENLLYDCCGTMKGLANSLGLSKCSSDEQSLAKRRDEQLCHYVDREVNKALGMWTSSYTLHFCCFPNKLNRILQEEGRKQLGLNWTRNCDGLSTDQISNLDFSKIDFSEVAEEYQKKIEEKLNIKKSSIDKKFQNKDIILENLQRKMDPNFKRVDK
jgi:hypothetical protein